jgi:aconitate hydratase
MIIEYYGPGLDALSAMDRHVIANMGTELGATTSVFPADEEARRFLEFQGREEDFTPMRADDDAEYDHHEEIDLGDLEPLIALPSSPGNVRRVADVAGEPIYQAYIGSSANPGLRDMAVPALMVEGRTIHDQVSFDINPTSRQNLVNLTNLGFMRSLITAGARIHQTGCNGCIGMGQAPATDGISLRTVPRNFPGRSGTKEDRVYLCSPETATASALTGVITDPRTLDMETPVFDASAAEAIEDPNIKPPPADGSDVDVRHGPNIVEIPRFDGLPERLKLPVLLKVGDDISTDEIMPAGSEVLPFRSNIPAISRFVFGAVDESFPERAREHADSGVLVVAGDNYGQGSSREHAALAPRYLGVRAVLAKGYARIHWENLCNFGILPLTFVDGADHDRIEQGDVLELNGVREAVTSGPDVRVLNATKDEAYDARHDLSERQIEMLLKGSLLAVMRERLDDNS